MRAKTSSANCDAWSVACSIAALALTMLTIMFAFTPAAYADDAPLQVGQIDVAPTMEIQAAADNADHVEMYRMYNPNSGEHFYTAGVGERNYLRLEGWKYEGVGWVAPSHSNTPVYRLYSGTDHHYTMSASERDHLVGVGWKYEGIGWYSDDAHTVPLLRLFNPNVEPSAATNNSGSHHYTTGVSERDFLVNVGWRYEGVGWYALAGGYPGEDWITPLKIANQVNQIIAVEARGTRATVSMHVKTNGTWNEIVSTSDGWVGKSGIGAAREGADYTPQGLMYPTEAFGIKANPGCPMGYLQVDGSHYWVGDSGSPYYNKMVSTRNTSNFDASASEHIASCGATYNYCLNMGWNTACTPGGGSAFFLHCSQGKPTDGCVTVPESTMIKILQTIRPGCALIVDTPSGIMRY